MAHVVDATVAGFEQRAVPAKRFVFVVELIWDNNTQTVVYRGYEEFFEFQCNLLFKFPNEAGETKGSTRIIPYLPGKVLFGSSSKSVAEKRVDEINDYLKKLVKLPQALVHDPLVTEFFSSKPSDAIPDVGKSAGASHVNSTASLLSRTSSVSIPSIPSIPPAESGSPRSQRATSFSKMFNRTQRSDSKLSVDPEPAQPEEIEMTDNPLTAKG